jgi:DNA-binding PadR family transcriptional regulator
MVSKNYDVKDFKLAETGRKRKYYSLKEDGRKAHKKQRDQWLKVHSVLAGLWKEKYA